MRGGRKGGFLSPSLCSPAKHLSLRTWQFISAKLAHDSSEALDCDEKLLIVKIISALTRRKKSGVEVLGGSLLVIGPGKWLLGLPRIGRE